ncbi:MAG: rRNA biogenesis protein [Methanimicrococcus sp.]|nr:rRNA biogenesis protein [Methanimicrococcus sp.]
MPDSSKSFLTWFGKLSYEGDFELSENLSAATPLELSDRLLLILSSSQNLKFVSALKPVFLKQKPDYRAAAKQAESTELTESDADYISKLRETAIQTARRQLSASLTEDKKVIQAVEALDDLNETINHLTERLVDWYSAYYPELDLSNEEYVRFVSKSPESTSKSQMGAPASHEDLFLMRSFADDVLSLYERKKAVESFIENKMGETAPNLSQLAGVVLGARLLSMACGLKNLAALPSGSIQVMGAEKAMVKHLRSNAPSPKHGIIFSHPLLNTAPFRLRGKIARAFAAAVSLAARTDYYSGKINPKIDADLNAKINRIKAANANREPKKNAAEVKYDA